MPALRTLSRMSLSTLAIVFAASSCDSSQGTQPMDTDHSHHTATAPSSVRYDSELAGAVRNATARFHSQTQSTKAGYAVASPCVAHPSAGGMGFHWVNGGLVDPTFDALKPEAVLYGPDGKLIAVEYIVVNIGQTAPTFGGHAFDVGGAPLPVAHWTLHVWLFEDNESGIFSPFNPAVVCP